MEETRDSWIMNQRATDVKPSVGWDTSYNHAIKIYNNKKMKRNVIPSNL